jgi:hypothetical protein
MHQHELYTVIPKPKGSHWEPIWRNQFVIRSGCVDVALSALQKSPQWKDLACRHDPEDLAVEIADRLEEVWGSMSEAAERIHGAVGTSVREKCVAQKKLTQQCFDGPSGYFAAQREAARILEEFGGDANDKLVLARELLVQTPLAPSDAELRAKFPALASVQELMTACLEGVVEISPKFDPAKRWIFWVKLPPTDERRGFKDPVWNAACQRDFAERLAAEKIAVDPSDKLFEHFAYLLKNESAPLIAAFNNQVLAHAGELKSECRVPATGDLGSSSCAAHWLEERLASLSPAQAADELARRLTTTLKAR